jgi:hypothetical protein
VGDAGPGLATPVVATTRVVGGTSTTLVPVVGWTLVDDGFQIAVTRTVVIIVVVSDEATDPRHGSGTLVAQLAIAHANPKLSLVLPSIGTAFGNTPLSRSVVGVVTLPLITTPSTAGPRDTTTGPTLPPPTRPHDVTLTLLRVLDPVTLPMARHTVAMLPMIVVPCIDTVLSVDEVVVGG